MNKDAEESSENFFAQSHKSFGERNIACRRKNVFIVDLTFNPVHEIFNVLRCGQCCWFLVLATVLPKVFIPEER